MTPLVRQLSVEAPLHAAAQRREYDAIAARIAADNPASILDWGCGHGQITDRLCAAGLNVEAFDYRGPSSPDALTPLPHFPSIKAFIASEPVRLPYPAARFDAILSCGVLEHVQDPDASLDELRRVLRPGGTLYVYKLPNRRSYLEWIARHVGLYYHGKLPYDRLYTPDSAQRLLESHGYEVSELRYANMLPLTLVARPLRPFGDGIWNLNRALARVPLLRTFATNVELVARSHR